MFVCRSQCTLNVVRLPGSLMSFWCMEDLGPQHLVFRQRNCVARPHLVDGMACQYFPLKVFMRTWVRLNRLSDGHIWLITSSYKWSKITFQARHSNHYSSLVEASRCECSSQALHRFGRDVGLNRVLFFAWKTCELNRVFPSCSEHHSKSEAKCKAFHVVKFSFVCSIMKINFHENYAQSLAFITRFKAIIVIVIVYL